MPSVSAPDTAEAPLARGIAHRQNGVSSDGYDRGVGGAVGEERFELGRELGEDGRWLRQRSAFREWVRADGSSGLPAVAGRYHLYVCKCCPWSHRTTIGLVLKGLEDAIGVSYAHPFRDARGWAFPGGEFTDRLNGFAFLSDAYEETEPGFEGRVSVPVLWDGERGRIVSNESGDILRMLLTEFDALARHEVDLYPEPLRPAIDELEERIYDTVNNGVYNAGFSTSQEAYEEAYEQLFATLDLLEARLGSSRYLVGDAPTEVDWRLFPTLVRFDSVYYSHFKCNRRRLVDYEHLWGYTRDLYQQPGIAATVDLAQIKQHYYTTHDMLNPGRIIPAGPDIDFLAPHSRS